MKKKSKVSIKVKLIGIIIPVIALAIVLLISISYIKSKEIITSEATAILHLSSKNQVDQIEAWLRENLASFESAKVSLEESRLSDASLRQALNRFDHYNVNYPEGLVVVKQNCNTYG